MRSRLKGRDGTKIQKTGHGPPGGYPLEAGARAGRPALEIVLRREASTSDNTVLCKLASKAGFRSHLYDTASLIDIHRVAKCEEIPPAVLECLPVVVPTRESCYE